MGNNSEDKKELKASPVLGVPKKVHASDRVIRERAVEDLVRLVRENNEEKDKYFKGYYPRSSV